MMKTELVGAGIVLQQKAVRNARGPEPLRHQDTKTEHTTAYSFIYLRVLVSL
jgi:hypothetical protein